MLTDKQKEAAQWIVVDVPIELVAKKVGIHRSTIWSWNKNEEFKGYVASLRGRIDAAKGLLLLEGVDIAVHTLITVMKESTNDSARVNACKIVAQLAGIMKNLNETTIKHDKEPLKEYLSGKSIPQVEQFLESLDKDNEPRKQT